MRKFLRILSLVLVILFSVSIITPPPVKTSAASVSEIEKQIRQIYQQALAHSGKSSFHGYCGGLVNAELYYLGITNKVLGNNGNQEYDYFCGQTITNGGYRVRAYSPSRYTLEQALNAISENGTKDVYNILVGFQATYSAAGSRYGHAVVIHAILDGTVYYMESYDVNLNGKRFPEGTPVHCTIPEFAAYYKRTTASLDGVIYFGTKSYADLCRIYPSYLTVTADGGAELRSQPCEASVDASSQYIRTPEAGEVMTATGLYLNSNGEYWYQIGDEGYLPADKTQPGQLLYDDLSVAEPTAPSVLRQGKGFEVEGTVSSQYNTIYSVRAQVTPLEGDAIPATSATKTLEGKTYNLKRSDISKELSFRLLDAGSYRYELAAIVENYYYGRSQLQSEWKTVNLWSSDFQIVEGSASYNILSFDPNGGTVAPDQAVVTAGEPVGELPTPTLESSVFLGWYTADDTRVDSGLIPREDITLTAKWIDEQALYENWQSMGQCLYFHCDGLTTTGCVEIDGALYYFTSVDAAGQSWTLWTVAENSMER